MTEVRFSVPGKPATAGSKRGFPFKGKDGRLHVAMSDDSGEKGKSWRALLVDSCRRAYLGPILDGPLVLDVTFRFLRPQAHFGKKGLLSSAPDYPAVKPDATKLIRALEDALNGVLWRDDSRIVVQRVRKVYGETEGADVRVSFATALPPTVRYLTAEATPGALPLFDDPSPVSVPGTIVPASVAKSDGGIPRCVCPVCLAERERGERP